MEHERKIIHIDMDAFFASIEQRDDDSLKGKPIVVGGNPDRRGVVCTCSYEARKYGIHSAMASSIAKKLCPHVIFVRPRMKYYASVSKEINDIFKSYSNLVEPLSLDEAFLDVTYNKKNIESHEKVANLIRKEIYDKTGLTSSAGVSYNKFLAKIASDYNKPNGIKVINKDDAKKFIEELDIGKFYGVGKVTKKKLNNLGIFTGKDLKMVEMKYLKRIFGKNSAIMYDFARGIDNREVRNQRKIKSISTETTFDSDYEINDKIVRETLKELSKDVSNRLIEKNVSGKTITLVLKFKDLKNLNRGITIDKSIQNSEEIDEVINILCGKIGESEKIRLIGIRISNLVLKNTEQYENISFFDLKK